jgi:hypothetical protein
MTVHIHAVGDRALNNGVEKMRMVDLNGIQLNNQEYELLTGKSESYEEKLTGISCLTLA